MAVKSSWYKIQKNCTFFVTKHMRYLLFKIKKTFENMLFFFRMTSRGKMNTFWLNYFLKLNFLLLRDVAQNKSNIQYRRRVIFYIKDIRITSKIKHFLWCDISQNKLNLQYRKRVTFYIKDVWISSCN